MEKCDREVFEKGSSVFIADTGTTGGARIFEGWVQLIARESKQRVDWHYSGGVASVLYLGNLYHVLVAINNNPLPKDPNGWQMTGRVISPDQGRYRHLGNGESIIGDTRVTTPDSVLATN
tara:strand:+ start:78 stop:437 length:360 start_codon:yes stop_codon:yes gene_type:complete